MHLHRDDLGPDDVDGIATSRERTLAQCLRHLPWDAALTVGDSALRNGTTPDTLTQIAKSLRGHGAPQARRVAAEARPEPANTFESVLRAIALDVPGISVRPQVKLRGAIWCQPDLVDAAQGIILEADSFAWHGDRGALRRDSRRYDLLVADGWLVLRFAWEDVMFDQDFVRQVLIAIADLVARRTHCRCCSRRTAWRAWQKASGSVRVRRAPA